MTESTESTEISNTRLWKEIRGYLKQHEIMNGSGHLFLKTQFRLTQEIVESTRQDVFAEMNNRGIPLERLERFSTRISELLWGVGKRQPPKPPRPPKQDRPKPKSKPKQKQQKPQQQDRPQLTVLRANRRVETRQVVIQVTVKKARNFHYPRDLPAGDVS